jgi:hypothetical protein
MGQTAQLYPALQAGAVRFATLHPMKMLSFPFTTTGWRDVPSIEHPGESGKAIWRTLKFGEIRGRMIEYSAGYLADHWCSKRISCFAWKESWRRNWPTERCHATGWDELSGGGRRSSAPIGDEHRCKVVRRGLGSGAFYSGMVDSSLSVRRMRSTEYGARRRGEW